MKRTTRTRKRTKKKVAEQTPVIDELKKLQDENLQQVSGGWCGGCCSGFKPPCY